MKWTEDKDRELSLLVNNGYRHGEISKIMNLSKRALANRSSRLGLRTIYHKEYICLECDNKFIENIKSNRKFCSSNCSGKFNSTNRIQSTETRLKIRNSILGRVSSDETRQKISGSNNINWIDGRSIPKRVKIFDGKRKCKYCKEFKITTKRKIICDSCRFTFYKLYRPLCEFKFEVTEFDEFDLSIIEKYGWYSPTNKGNNLGGISRDHIYSIKDGFINNICPDIISHPANCKLMIHNENSKKNSRSDITIDELILRIKYFPTKKG